MFVLRKLSFIVIVKPNIYRLYRRYHSYQLIWPKYSYYQELQNKTLFFFFFFFILTTAPNMVTKIEYPNWNFDGDSSSNLCLVACFRVILMLGFLYRNLKQKLWNLNIIVDPFFINVQVTLDDSKYIRSRLNFEGSKVWVVKSLEFSGLTDRF